MKTREEMISMLNDLEFELTLNHRWGYYEIKSKHPWPPVDGETNIHLRAGTFRSLDDALAFVAKMEKMGIHVNREGVK